MKTIYLLVLLAVTFGAGFLIGKSSNHPIRRDAKPLSSISDTNEDIAVKEYGLLVNYLDHTKQTNALKELFHWQADDQTSRDGLQLAYAVAILNALREGQTTNMQRYFEKELDREAVSFSDEYSGLPTRLQKQLSLKPLRSAREYRMKYPFNDPDIFWAGRLTNAFNILDSDTNSTTTSTNKSN